MVLGGLVVGWLLLLFVIAFIVKFEIELGNGITFPLRDMKEPFIVGIGMDGIPGIGIARFLRL